MAKRKTPKVKDLGPKKISEDQLNKIQNLVKAMNEGQQQLGMIETKKHNLLHDIMQLQDMISAFQKELQEEHGSVDININDGSITPREDEQVNS